MKTGKVKQLALAGVTGALILISLWLLQKLVTPKYMSDVTEGALIAEYYKEEKDHDVIFIGDCEVYENFSPYVLWKEYGINSYIRGSAQQLIWQSYYLLEDTLRYETPKVLVFNVLSMKYGMPQKEAYNRMTLEGMEWSSSKIKAIQASMLEEESMLDYIFPILRYHSRIWELEKEDVTYIFHREKIAYNGYYMRTDVKAAGYVPEGIALESYELEHNAYHYLDKLTKLCKDNNIQLLLIKAPSLYPYWYPEWDAQIQEYAKKNDLAYINLMEQSEEIGLDFTRDTYDAGLHLNVYGAEKLSYYFGQYLTNQCGLTSRRGEEELENVWKEKMSRYEKGKADGTDSKE